MVIKTFLHATLALLFSFAKDLVNGFMCNCTDGFEGEACETDHDDCQPYPCENNGTCTVRVILYNYAVTLTHHVRGIASTLIARRQLTRK